jgi:hypothetical protein
MSARVCRQDSVHGDRSAPMSPLRHLAIAPARCGLLKQRQPFVEFFQWLSISSSATMYDTRDGSPKIRRPSAAFFLRASHYERLLLLQSAAWYVSGAPER